jgi:hypothetical protein
MAVTRRRFLETASLAVLAGAAVPSTLAQSASALKNDPFRDQNLALFNGVSEETFKPYMGERFALEQGGRQVGSLTLVSITTQAGAQPSSAKGIKSFAVHLSGSGAMLPQGTYTLSHESMGTISLFLVPAGKGANHPTYTATFSLLAD